MNANLYGCDGKWLMIDLGVSFGGEEYPGIDIALFALVIVIMIIYEPRGLFGIWVKVRTWLEMFPLYRKGLFRRSKTYLKTERMR